jgi:hypothetical protein
MTYKLSQDNISKTYSSLEYYTGQISDINQDTIFGITMQCPKPIQHNCYTDFYVYHVDISSSRGFDKISYYEKISESSELNNETFETIRNENKYLFSKTPQILSIDNDFITIIKSKMKNTRIHLPRPNYEKIIKIKNLTSLDYTKSPYYDKKYIFYKKKYMIYKKKYLQLKNNY